MSITFPKSFDDAFFKSFTGARLKFIEGTDRSFWVDMDDNEALDCWVYAYARHLLIEKNMPGTASVFKAAHLDRTGQWAVDHFGKPDRSWQSELLEAERRATGGLTSEQLSVRRFVPPPQSRHWEQKLDPSGPGRPQGPQGVFGARPNPWI